MHFANESLAGPASNWWHWSEIHLEALARLEYFAAAQWPLAVVDGPSGTGKSRVARYFAEGLRRQGREVAFVDVAPLDALAFESEVARELRSTGSALDAIRSRVATEQPFVLVVDHATQRTDAWLGFADAMLRVGDARGRAVVSIVVVGDGAQLASDWSRSRSALRIDVDALDVAGVEAFVSDYFESSDRSCPFDEAGIDALSEVSAGRPRELVTLLGLIGCIGRKRILGPNDVLAVARETGLSPQMAPASAANADVGPLRNPASSIAPRA